jgi:hypothetical protein
MFFCERLKMDDPTTRDTALGKGAWPLKPVLAAHDSWHWLTDVIRKTGPRSAACRCSGGDTEASCTVTSAAAQVA